MFTIENFPEEYFGYKVIDRNENVLFLEYSYSNIYWIKNKAVAVKFNTCRTGFIVEYIKEFLGDYSNVRIGMVEARLDESING